MPAPTPPLRPNLTNEANSGSDVIPRSTMCLGSISARRSGDRAGRLFGSLLLRVPPVAVALEATKAAELINGFAQSGLAGLPEPLHSSK